MNSNNGCITTPNTKTYIIPKTLLSCKKVRKRQSLLMICCVCMIDHWLNAWYRVYVNIANYRVYL